MVINVPWSYTPKHWLLQQLMAIGKETSNPLIFNDSPLTGVNTPGSDENRYET